MVLTNPKTSIRRIRLEARAKEAYGVFARRAFAGAEQPAFEQLPVAEWYGWLEVAASLGKRMLQKQHNVDINVYIESASH